ncbi:MAG: prolipoprotein diacylglyceryl transferase, partial [Rickettsiaceae bacterium]|nr:prolipoprotein diacylglyceryl transferase [Rickettsiaceae bacterium]
WYSLSYVFGVLIGWYYANKIIDRYDIGVTKKHFEDFITWIIIGLIVGARLGHVFFYELAYYINNPIDILKTYEGGMSFHGGVLGLFLAAYFFARKHKIPFFSLGDLMAAGAPIGLMLGRITNFINAELYGRITDVPWAFIFPGSDGKPRHPSQLYEAALEGVVLFLILFIAIMKFGYIKKRGFISGLFLIFYALFRSIVEFFRVPDGVISILGIVDITTGQMLSLPMIIFGIYCLKMKDTNADRLKS